MVFRFGWQAILNVHFLQQNLFGAHITHKAESHSKSSSSLSKNYWCSHLGQSTEWLVQAKNISDVVLQPTQPQHLGRLQGNLLSGIEPLNCWLPLRQTLGHRFSCSPRASPAPEHNFKIHLESPICSGRGSLPMAANPLSLFCQFWKALLTAVELLNLYKIVQAPRSKNQAPSTMIVQAPKRSFTCIGSSPLHSALLNLWVCTKIKLFLRKCQEKRITANCLYSYQQSGYSSEQVSSSTNFVFEVDCWRESSISSVHIALGVLEWPELNHLLDPLWRG